MCSSDLLFLMSDQDLVYSTTGTPQVTNLALLADLDNNGNGKLVLQTPVAANGNLRISANDIDAGTSGAQLSAVQLLVRSGQSEQIRVDLKPAGVGQPGTLDAASAADLEIVADSAVQLQDLNGDGTALQSSLPTGNLSLLTNGNLLVSSKLQTSGNITLYSTGNLTVNAQIDPEQVSLSAADDILINSRIDAVRLVKISAGDDGTGSLLTTAASRIEATNGAAIGDITLSAGSTVGSMQLNGFIRAAGKLSASVPAGSLNADAELQAGILQLQAATGIGQAAPIRVSAASITAETQNGDLQLISSGPTVFDSLSTGTGDIRITSNGHSDFSNVRTNNGQLRLNVVSGNLKLGTGTAVTGSIFLTTTSSGNLLIDLANASGLLVADSAGSITDSTNDTDIDINAAQIQLRARSGIGTTTNALGLSGPNATVTAFTATGDIVLQTGSSITVGQVDQQSGLQISDPDNADGQNLISVTAAGRLIIDSPIVNQSAGSIQLTATDHIIQSASTLILTSGSGMISLVAGTAQSSIGADITMQDGAGIVSQQGRIQLHSSGSVRLSSEIGRAHV